MKYILGTVVLSAIVCVQASAHPVLSERDAEKEPAFDILRAEGSSTDRLVTFAMEVAGQAGSVKPAATGQLTGAKVESYVWPTNLDPSVVGFKKKSGILALAVTAHPDFDDTPLFDEDQDGDPANDGADWHSHWVVLVKDENCGAGLKVRDVSPGKAVLPATAPGLPIALDSPGMSPIMGGNKVHVTVPLTAKSTITFDAVTAELTVNAAGEAPLLCVTTVHDIGSGDLSLPGKVMAK